MIFGVGYKGNDYNVKTDKDLYQRWVRMIQRCYSPKCKDYADYGAKGVTVSEEWFNFSNFKKWWNDNYWECPNEWVCVDKDILVPNSKIYSPNTCLILPFTINSMLSRFGKEDKNKNVKVSAGGITKLENGLYRLSIFGTSFSTFVSKENALETRKAVYKALFDGLINNYPNMPQRTKDAIYKYAFETDFNI